MFFFIYLQDGTSDFLPKLPSLSRTFGSMNENVEENLEDAKKVKDQSNLNFLVVGFGNGKISLSVFGLFPCGVIDACEILGEEECSVLDADISQDMKSLFVIVCTGKEKKCLKLLILDTRILSSRSRELHALALKHGHIISLLDYLEQTMQAIKEAFEIFALNEIDSKLATYAESMPEGSVSADFLELLMFGTTTDALEKFLLHDLSDKGIKKLGHSIEHSHSNIQKLILKHLHSVGQSLAYHLAELKGMAKLTDRFKVLGLDEDTVAASFIAAGAFLVKSTEVQLVIDDSMKKYKAFFRWLYAVILKVTDDRIPDLTLTDVNQQDLSFIADYLHSLDDIKPSSSGETPTRKKQYLDRLGQYLLDKELTNPPDTSNNPWLKLLEENECLAKHPSIIPRFKKTSLVQQHKHLKDAIDKVFRTPETFIGKLFQLKMAVVISDIHNKIRISMVQLPDEQKLNLALVQLESISNEFKFIEVNVDTDASNVLRTVNVYFNSVDKTKMKPLDVQFYLPETLSVLLEPIGENRNAVFIQLPTKDIRGSTSDTIEGNSLVDAVALRPITDMIASTFAVSGHRKIAVVLSDSRRKVRLFEMEVEEEEEDEEVMEATVSSKDSDNSVLDISKTDQQVD